MAAFILKAGEQIPTPWSGTTFADAQRDVGGLVQAVKFANAIMLVNEEGALRGLPTNEAASRACGQPISGTVVVMSNADWTAMNN